MKKTLLLLSIILLYSCGQSQEKKAPSGTLISNVSVVDVTSGEIIENQQVVIDLGKIKSVNTNVANVSEYLKVIDGSGKFMMPGLAEMHAHISPPTTSRERIEEILFLYCIQTGAKEYWQNRRDIVDPRFRELVESIEVSSLTPSERLFRQAD